MLIEHALHFGPIMFHQRYPSPTDGSLGIEVPPVIFTDRAPGTRMSRHEQKLGRGPRDVSPTDIYICMYIYIIICVYIYVLSEAT